jgi:3-oxoacyl-[acyl-carrier protein] reductase
MIEHRFGRIVTIVSSGVVQPIANLGASNALRAAIVGWSKTLSNEVAANGVTVNCVAPGLVETAMTDKLNDEQRAKILTAVPVGRIGRPEEIAAGVVFLASVEAGSVTGATLDINGGGDML